jgi:hypothetical protein
MSTEKTHAVFLRGGLGNQFFQWLYALHLQEQGIAVTLDDSFMKVITGNQALGHVELHKVFSDLHMPITSRLRHVGRAEPLYVRLAHAMGSLQIESRGRWLPGTPHLHYGYYQTSAHWTTSVSRKVFDRVRPEFRPKGHPAFPDSLRAKRYAAIHLRGGDYLQAGYNFIELGLLAPAYYARAIASPAVPGLPIVIVSDDDRRARRIIDVLTLTGREVHHLTDLTPAASDPMLALSVMLSADGLVCANSSFSAMSGYLNPHAVVARPSPWFRGASLTPVSPARQQWHAVASTFETGQG